jgi:D-tyrosyl-tRNA(Tyr) deacylase
MRVVIQRVNSASVVVNNQTVGAIEKGLLALAAWEENDTQEDIEWMCNKIINQRIFSDQEGKMNLSLSDTNGSILLVSQFTLFASTKKGNRPSFIRSAKPEMAKTLYENTISWFETTLNTPIATGVFGADMKVSLENDGPVTIVIDSKNKE